MKRDQPVLNIYPQAELEGRADQNPDVAAPHLHEQLRSFQFGFGIMNIGDLYLRDAEVRECGLQFVINVKPGLGCGSIAKNQLRRFALYILKINICRIFRTSRHLGLIGKCRIWINQPQVERRLSAVRCDFQHIVDPSTDHATSYIVGSL